jgi:hypothetical protein
MYFLWPAKPSTWNQRPPNSERTHSTLRSERRRMRNVKPILRREQIGWRWTSRADIQIPICPEQVLQHEKTVKKKHEIPKGFRHPPAAAVNTQDNSRDHHEKYEQREEERRGLHANVPRGDVVDERVGNPRQGQTNQDIEDV